MLNRRFNKRTSLKHINIVERLVNFLSSQYDKDIKIMIASDKTLAEIINTKPAYLRDITNKNGSVLGINGINGHYVIHTIACNELVKKTLKDCRHYKAEN